MSHLEELRAEYQIEAKNRKWWQREPQGDGMLYLGARMRDAEDDKHLLEKRCAAMESAAMRILGRYDSDGTAYHEWKQEVERRVSCS